MGQVRDLHGLEVWEGTGMEDRKAEPGTLQRSVESEAGREAGREWSNNHGMCWPLLPGEGHWRYSEQEALVM